MARTIKLCQKCGECSKIGNKNGELKKIMECLNISEAELCLVIKCDRDIVHDILFNDSKIQDKFLNRINDYIGGYGVSIE